MEICWRGFFRVNDEAAARVIATRMGTALGRRIALTRCERYWKDKALFGVELVSPLYSETLGDAALEALSLAQTVGGSWAVTGPDTEADGSGRFEGLLTLSTGRFTIAGIEFLEFHVAYEPGQAAPQALDTRRATPSRAARTSHGSSCCCATI